MRRILICAVVFVSLGCVSYAQSGWKLFSEETAKQFIHRFPDADAIRWGMQENSFSWQSGYIMFALEHLWRWSGETKFYDYIKDFVDKNVDCDGNLRQFSPDALDNFLPGYACLLLYEQTGEGRYAKAAETIRAGFDTYPRFDNGMFWHSRGIRQVWVDGVFMGQMFLARYAKTMGHPEDFTEVVRQMKGIMDLCGKDNGHFLHAWDEEGPSQEVWSEGMGWLAVLWADVFDFLPEDMNGRQELLDRLSLMCKGLKQSQDPLTGMWCQVVDKPSAPGNWNETSGTGMFLYLIQKAISKGFVSEEEFSPATRKAYEGILKKAIVNADGYINLMDCSSIGVQRDYESYISQPHEISTFAAYASFILGTGIMEHGCPMTNENKTEQTK